MVLRHNSHKAVRYKKVLVHYICSSLTVSFNSCAFSHKNNITKQFEHMTSRRYYLRLSSGNGITGHFHRIQCVTPRSLFPQELPFDTQSHSCLPSKSLKTYVREVIRKHGRSYQLFLEDSFYNGPGHKQSLNVADVESTAARCDCEIESKSCGIGRHNGGAMMTPS